MADVLAEHLTEDAQVKLYRGTVLTILKEGGDKLPLTVDEQVELLVSSACHTCTHVNYEMCVSTLTATLCC